MEDPRLQDLEFERLIQAAEAIEAAAAHMAEWLRDAWRAPKNRGGLSWQDRPLGRQLPQGPDGVGSAGG